MYLTLPEFDLHQVVHQVQGVDAVDVTLIDCNEAMVPLATLDLLELYFRGWQTPTALHCRRRTRATSSSRTRAELSGTAIIYSR
jgi:hypothetical protein